MTTQAIPTSKRRYKSRAYVLRNRRGAERRVEIYFRWQVGQVVTLTDCRGRRSAWRVVAAEELPWHWEG